MKLIFQFLQRESKSFYFYLLLLSVVNSMLYSSLLYIITSAINETELMFFNEYKAALFLIFVGLSFFSNKLFQSYSIKLTNRILYREELAIIKRLKACSYNSFEKIGIEKIYTVLGDSRTLGNTPNLLLTFINSSIIIICGLGYLFYTFPLGSLLILGIMAALFLFYMWRNKAIQKDLNTMRDLHNEFHKYLRDFLHGVKELKTNQPRNQSIYNGFLKKNRDTTQLLDLNTLRKYMVNEITGDYSWYLVLFIVLFMFPWLFDFPNEKSTTFVMVIFFLMGPVSSIIGLISDTTRIKIAFERIEEFQTDTRDVDLAEPTVTDEVIPQFDVIEFQDVCYEHRDEQHNAKFKVGPLNLRITNGEVVFITGGNGSGKSTFMYLLVGLYKPISGKIFLNGLDVTNDLDQLSHYVTPVFTDHHLFSENYDMIDHSMANKELYGLIKLTKLQNVVKSENGELFDQNLSRGQRKRMSLVYALLEKKPIMVLDEWAAEQDPYFKNYFYEVLIPFFKKSGKTIVAITHDNKFFEWGERHIEFEFGAIKRDEQAALAES